MNSIHAAYLAGVWDSDGSFSICRRHPKYRKNPTYYERVYTLNKQLNSKNKGVNYENN